MAPMHRGKHMEKTFSIGGAFSEARAIIKPKFWPVIGQYLLIGFVLSLVFSALFGKGAIIGSLITGYVGVKWVLAYVRKGSFHFDDIFENLTFKKFMYFILATFLAGVAIVWPMLIVLAVWGLYMVISTEVFSTHIFADPITIACFALAFVLTIIFAIRYVFVKYLIIEKDISPMQALRESRKMAKGNGWKIFGFFVAAFFINLLGFICLIVGVFYTAPLTALAFASVYKKLSGGEPVAEEAQPEEVIVETVEVVQA